MLSGVLSSAFPKLSEVCFVSGGSFGLRQRIWRCFGFKTCYRHTAKASRQLRDRGLCMGCLSLCGWEVSPLQAGLSLSEVVCKCNRVTLLSKEETQSGPAGFSWMLLTQKQPPGVTKCVGLGEMKNINAVGRNPTAGRPWWPLPARWARLAHRLPAVRRDRGAGTVQIPADVWREERTFCVCLVFRQELRSPQRACSLRLLQAA